MKLPRLDGITRGVMMSLVSFHALRNIFSPASFGQFSGCVTGFEIRDFRLRLEINFRDRRYSFATTLDTREGWAILDLNSSSV